MLISLVLLAGCATGKPKSKTDAKSAADLNAKASKKNSKATPQLELGGKVVSVNSTLRFVVLEFPVGEMPGLNQRLDVYRQGRKVGELKTSGPQEETNIVADITEGEAQVGDDVRRE